MLENEFFPTPAEVVLKMRREIKERNGKERILDPSAGHGALLDSFLSTAKHTREKVYAIEIDQDLRYILNGKGARVIGADFLDYNTEAMKFDLILMNPPFSKGTEHVLKAWGLVDDGGQLISLLPTDTLRNLCTKERVLLSSIVQQFQGKVIDLGQCFQNAERPTNVNISMICISKPSRAISSNFMGLDIDMDSVESSGCTDAPLAHPQPIKNLVARYKVAERILIDRWELQQKLDFYMGGIDDIVYGSVDRGGQSSINSPIDLQEQVSILKSRFWNTVFAKTNIGKRTTSKFQRDFAKFSIDQSSMAFTENNIMEVLGLFINNNEQIMGDCLVEVFDRATAYHEKNKVHTEGWKTNKSYKVGKRIIVPRGVIYENYLGFSFCYHQDSRLFLNDLDKVLCWATGKNPSAIASLTEALELHLAKVNGRKGYEKIEYSVPGESEFFTFKIFKKGTLWIDFKDKQVLDTFNRRAAEGKKWLGADY